MFLPPAGFFEVLVGCQRPVFCHVFQSTSGQCSNCIKRWSRCTVHCRNLGLFQTCFWSKWLKTCLCSSMVFMCGLKLICWSVLCTHLTPLSTALFLDSNPVSRLQLLSLHMITEENVPAWIATSREQTWKGSPELRTAVFIAGLFHNQSHGKVLCCKLCYIWHMFMYLCTVWWPPNWHVAIHKSFHQTASCHRMMMWWKMKP